MISLPDIADGEDKSSPLANRIRKNYRLVKKWAKKSLTNAFRIYDKEIREYPVAIDYYDGRFCVHYFSPSRITSEPPQPLIDEIKRAIKIVFGEVSNNIFLRVRAKQKKTRQYEKESDVKDFFTIYENGIKFKINLIDYLDTGLFLDHRETRKLVGSISKDKKVLNLFAYTCSFSLYAALGGASFTKSVDLSNTYTAWGRDNFILNDIPLKNHPIVRADCLKFLEEELNKYDIIVIDPPTISRSKKMEGLFDLQQDYVFLISKSLKLLNPNGTIIFSTNSRNFKFDAALFPDCTIVEITNKTLPLDFHDPKIHRCWKIWQ